MKFIKKSSVVIYIDYSAAVLISRQINFIISNINKLNLRLIRVFQYLSMFDFFMRHKTNKANVIFDALSRLSRNSITITKNGSRVLKVLYEQILKIIKNNFSSEKKKTFLQKLSIIYHVTFVKMFDDFKSRLFFKYIKNEQWNKILEII